MMRGVRAAGCVMNKERLIGIECVDSIHVVDRVVGHRRSQIPGSRCLTLERVDLRRVAEKVRLPLAGVAAHEAVEVLEPHADGPLVERSVLAGLKRWRIVLLAEPGGAVTVI